MKKFTTKILPRRLQGRGTPADERKTITGPELSDARDFHQLTSTSRRGVAALNKRPTRNGMSRISVLPVDKDGEDENGRNGNHASNERDGNDSDHEQTNGHTQQQHDLPIVCQHCAAIGFSRLLDWKPGQPRPWVSLTHTLSDTTSCPYCTFFQAMIGHVPSMDASRGAGGDSETPSVSESDAGSAPPSYTGTFTPYLRIRHAFERMGVGQKHELGRQVLFEVTTKNKALPRGYILRCGEDEMGLDGYLESSEAAGSGGDGEAKETIVAGIIGRTVPPILDPNVPKCWIEFCKANHGELRCGTATNAAKDLRVIDIKERKVIRAGDLDAGFEYVTLSYAAGEAYNDTDSLDKTTGLPFEFPPLIRDAISLTASLGYHYIWIDRYCAPSPDTAASRRQFMDSLGDIFLSSVLTVIVAAGNGLEDDIPGISVPREDQLSLQNEAGLFTTSLVRPDTEVAASKWTTRTWTLQAGLLSRRRLVLTPSQAYFQCGALHCHESVSVPLRCAADFTLGRVFPLQGVEGMDVRAFIGAYMTRAYERAEGRLDACRAIWRAFAKRADERVEMFLGLPLFAPDAFANLKIVSQTDRLAVGLSWHISNRATGSLSTAQPPPSTEADCSLDKSLHFPSWTWLAWNIRPGSDAAHNPRAFRIHLANEGTALTADGLCAPPGTEISVGFADGLVVSWEIDGEAIARRTERIAFLRIRTFCFDVLVSKNVVDGADDAATAATAGLKIEGEAEGVLDPSAREAILSSVIGVGNETVKEQVKLIAVLIAGKNWKSHGPVEATALICAHREWDEEKPLVRIGLFGMRCDELVPEASSGDGVDAGEGYAVLKGVGDDGAGKASLRADVREIDLY